MNQKTILILGITLYLVTAIGSFFVFAEPAQPEPEYAPPTGGDLSNLEEGPQTEVCPLNGNLHTVAQRELWETRRPLGIMVENHTESRPQSGLSSADIVYEVVAEGGITRFLSIFYCDNPEMVGPVRSARIYFIRLLQGYGNHPLYAHVGGANTPGPADALGELKEIGWDNYNAVGQFGLGFPYYWRDYDRLPGVATEHTMYTDPSLLWEFAAEEKGLGYEDEDGIAWDEDFRAWEVDDSDPEVGDVTSIRMSYWEQFAGDYSVDWEYDSEDNSYLRFNGGEPHMDKNTDEQLEVSTVMVAFSDESEANDGYENGTHLLYDLTSGNDAIVFKNGQAIEGTWEKDDFESSMIFYSEDGEEIAIAPGKVWVHILPSGNEVDYGAGGSGADAEEEAADDETETGVDE